jgi:plastocyanin
MTARTPVRRSPAVLLAPFALALALVAGGCGGGDDAAADLPAVADSEFEDLTGESSVKVDAVDNAFEPRYIRISPGTEVEFDNVGRNPHNVVPAEEGQFETIPTDQLQPGQQASLTFDEPGTYPYYCSLHGTASRGMTGRIVVEEG